MASTISSQVSTSGVGPGCLAAPAAELSPISYPGVRDYHPNPGGPIANGCPASVGLVVVVMVGANGEDEQVAQALTAEGAGSNYWLTESRSETGAPPPLIISWSRKAPHLISGVITGGISSPHPLQSVWVISLLLPRSLSSGSEWALGTIGIQWVDGGCSGSGT
ncbi:hypothetical protein Tco_1571502 [Tanacetum coccineum]